MEQKRESELTICPRCGTPAMERDIVSYLDRGEMCRRCLGLIRKKENTGELKKSLLPEVYAEQVREKMRQLCSHKYCKRCYGRGYVGMNDNNLVITCDKCVDQGAAYLWFRSFVREHEDLHEMFPWALADAKAEDVDADALAKHRDAEDQRPREVHEGEE